ncbi:A disintegrin and metalloproteinase with thrombospondin motifs 18-like [Ruditapes philippinarum]|uniref:A disintegrin and metalloproteinase with thrombospondin motifs 18-like n=1 Tax=Ruditapes philippinarum TaxID=129788 RepID=UPI00295B6AA8|nr:A disintegrin and metalloproteinase with thrombospondin motifs 18-like [Ruditapes philippinarum]XP_060600095.1 A disintegrin and metalloproteinase with thrombospondin motifs 18-like [Ruditapes philippinarum]XP_060600096.1 A disintegrin and metalloproteinase with thrombospondin motifs 18-like [Ruditapes philippinarum]XP_060600097.1 A disintegrin and metalloproteinase with thrombospondin motifs 18-like [Ruditapes philippinarum]XP_060600098.1 A disintegrin and metalloproteinase with thrombospon
MFMFKSTFLYLFLLKIYTFSDAVDKIKEQDSVISERVKRNVETIIIETVVILDADYISYLKAKGHNTNESLYELVALKWMGAQAEWGRKDVFGYDVRIAIKDIVLWETNPTWFVPSTELDTTLYRLCSGTKSRGLWKDYDHIFLFTGKKNTDGYSGKANTGEICQDGGKCALSAITSVVEYVITAHELGHSMGMGHDGDVGCPSPNDGIMGSRSLSWSRCSVGAMEHLLKKSTASCLFTTNIPANDKINITEAWPGMVYSNDEICGFKHGPGFRYKANNEKQCPSYQCVNLNTTSSFYGVSFSYITPTDGGNCGQEMVCVSRKVDGSNCISWNSTGLDRLLFKTVKGNWSPWAEMTSCSRTCGTGVRYRQRTCNNPKPQNSVWCEGNEYDAEICNTEVCENDSLVESQIIKQRASETCSYWKTNNVYAAIEEDHTNYLNTGKKYNNNNGQCEVKCDRVSNYTGGKNKRNGLMPNGTPCSPLQLSSFVEKNNLPRRSGMFGKCIHGQCYLFGCDNKTGNPPLTRDRCGVCDGNNSTCTTVEGVYEIIVGKGQRGIIDVVPANASLIQFYFTYGTMKNHFLELRTPDTDTGVIIFRTLDTTKDPVKFAGTEWYLLWSKQYLYAEGPLTQDVVIKLYNYGTFNNTGVKFAYSLPKPYEDTTTTTLSTSTLPTTTQSKQQNFSSSTSIPLSSSTHISRAAKVLKRQRVR